MFQCFNDDGFRETNENTGEHPLWRFLVRKTTYKRGATQSLTMGVGRKHKLTQPLSTRTGRRVGDKRKSYDPEHSETNGRQGERSH